MRKLIVSLLLFALSVSAVWAQPAPAQSEDARRLFIQIEEILSELSKISGLKPRQSIEHDMIDKARIKQFLEERIKEVVKPEELRAEELVLKKFGFVPADFDLKKTTIDLLTEQATAFYDFRKRKLFVLDSAPSALQQVALVHELAHALADQHFNLEKFIEHASKSDDSTGARMAVMEGQATWLMSEYLARRTGQSLKTSPAIVQLMSRAAEMSAGQFPVFDRAPLYMRETLLFPYSHGMLFQHAVFEKSGQAAFTDVFRRPPVSTQQVMHPEKYFAGVKPEDPALPVLKTEREYRELTQGTIGELDHSILLRQFVGEAEAESISPRWTGGKYRLLERKNGKRTVLAYASQWENASAAKEYFRQYRTVLERKWKAMEVISENENVVTGRGDDGHFFLRLDGPRVTSLEGMESPGEAKDAAALN